MNALMGQGNWCKYTQGNWIQTENNSTPLWETKGVERENIMLEELLDRERWSVCSLICRR